MAFTVSTGYRNMDLGADRATVHGSRVANTISFDNTSSEIRDSSNGFLTAGFLAGDKVTVTGTASNDGTFLVTSVAAGAMVTETAPVTEAAGTYFGLAAATGGTFRDIFRNGVLRVYSGSQPTNADSAVTGTLLLEITVDGGTFTAGVADNGLNFAEAADAAISKVAADTWKATGLATGTAGWFRLCGNAEDSGAASTTLPRLDGNVGTSTTADMQLASTSIALDSVYYLNNASFSFPLKYGV